MEIFVIIPSLLILKSLEHDDKEICTGFYPDMFDETSKQGQQYRFLQVKYEQGRQKFRNDFAYYNLIEGCLLEIDGQSAFNIAEYKIEQIVKEIKGLAMCLSRFKPADWNMFLDVVIK